MPADRAGPNNRHDARYFLDKVCDNGLIARIECCAGLFRKCIGTTIEPGLGDRIVRVGGENALVQRRSTIIAEQPILVERALRRCKQRFGLRAARLERGDRARELVDRCTAAEQLARRCD